MEAKTVTGMAVGLTVVVILAATFMIPVLNDATTTHETFENEGWYYMTDTTTEHTYVFDGSTWTVDGETLDHTLAGVNIIATDTFFIRDIGQVGGAYSISNITAFNLTVSENAITGTYTRSGTETEVNWSFTKFYGATEDKTEYILSDKNLDPIAYLTKDSDVFGYGRTTLGETQVFFQIEGNANDGITVTCNNPSVTTSEVDINLVAVDGYSDLYTFEGVTFVATLNGVDYDCLYNIIIVPSEVTGELAQHLNDGEIALINVIPIMIIVSLVIAAVGIVATGRRD